MNNSSLKDAIVIFGGGCTGEIVSPTDCCSPITTAVTGRSSRFRPWSTTTSRTVSGPCRAPKSCRLRDSRCALSAGSSM